MEWKKVRNWLILLLLTADLILAGNIGWQVLQMRRSEWTAVEDAMAVAARAGVTFPAEALRALPERPKAYQLRRDNSREAQTAQALLGAERASEPGGGVSIYQSDRGQLSFRRGGAVELSVVWQQDSIDGSQCLELLEEAGFPMEQARLFEAAGQQSLLQQYGGRTVFNCRLQWSLQGGYLQVRGRWLMNGDAGAETETQPMSRAQLTLSLCALLQERGLRGIRSLEMGYYLQSEDPQTAVLVPVWAAETAKGRLLLSCLDGTELNN